jgi:hypothetical protein
VAQNHLLHIGLNLRHRIGELVIGVVDLLGAHAILHRNRNGDKDVVLGFGLHGQRDLIHAQAYDARHGVEERPFPVQSRIGDA